MIKKVICICLIAVILIPGIACALSLDNTYLPEEIRLLIQKEETLNGFELITADDDTLRGFPTDISLVMLAKGECCVLFVARETDAGWITQACSRKSLYPTKAMNEGIKLTKNDSHRFEVSWPGETYCFYAGGTDHYSWLYQAILQTDKGECIAQREEDGPGMRFVCGEDNVIWNIDEYKQQTWRNFNPLLFPKGIDAVEQDNILLTLLPESIYSGKNISIKKLSKSTHLYNCPSKKSKEMDVSQLFQQDTFIYYGNTDDKWYFIGYQNGLENACLGYISQKDFHLSKRERNITSFSFFNEQLVAKTDTWITLDPYLSQEKYKEIPAGTKMIGLNGFDADYVYVEVEIDGDNVRGFVPMQNLDTY